MTLKQSLQIMKQLSATWTVTLFGRSSTALEYSLYTHLLAEQFHVLLFRADLNLLEQGL